jgi:hypothetical protein
MANNTIVIDNCTLAKYYEKSGVNENQNNLTQNNYN